MTDIKVLPRGFESHWAASAGDEISDVHFNENRLFKCTLYIFFLHIVLILVSVSAACSSFNVKGSADKLWSQCFLCTLKYHILLFTGEEENCPFAPQVSFFSQFLQHQSMPSVHIHLVTQLIATPIATNEQLKHKVQPTGCMRTGNKSLNHCPKPNFKA